MATTSYDGVLGSKRTPDFQTRMSQDAVLVAHLRGSNQQIWQEAAREWFNRDRATLESYVYYQASSKQGAAYARSIVDDIVQESFLRALRKISNQTQSDATYEHELLPLLKGIAVNILREYARQGKRLEPLTTIDAMGEEIERPLVDGTQELETTFLQKSEYESLGQILKGMNAAERNVLERVFLQEEPRAEVAKSMEISQGNLRIKVFRALQEFRRMLPDEMRRRSDSP